MAKHQKYLLTVDAETGHPVRIERMGETGDLEEVPLEGLGVAGERAPTTQIINVYVGGQPPPAEGRRGSPPQPTPGCIFRGPHRPPKPTDEDD